MVRGLFTAKFKSLSGSVFSERVSQFEQWTYETEEISKRLFSGNASRPRVISSAENSFFPNSLTSCSMKLAFSAAPDKFVRVPFLTGPLERLDQAFGAVNAAPAQTQSSEELLQLEGNAVLRVLVGFFFAEFPGEKQFAEFGRHEQEL